MGNLKAKIRQCSWLIKFFKRLKGYYLDRRIDGGWDFSLVHPLLHPRPLLPPLLLLLPLRLHLLLLLLLLLFFSFSSSSFCTFSPSPPFLLELGEPEKVENTPSAIYPIIQKCTTINSFCSQCGKCSPTEAGIPKNGFCTELAFIQGHRVRLFLHSIQQGLAITYVARLLLKLCSVRIQYSKYSHNLRMYRMQLRVFLD